MAWMIPMKIICRYRTTFFLKSQKIIIMALSKLAEKQLNEIQYAFGCGKDKAISYALESLHAFEEMSGDQVYSYLEENCPDAFIKWQTEHKDDRVKLESN